MKLVVKPAGRLDILSQAAYFAEQGGGELSDRFLTSVERSFRRLLDHPNAGAPRPFDNPVLVGLRAWPISDFEDIRAYYLVADNQISVLRVLHGKRDLPHTLEDD